MDNEALLLRIIEQNERILKRMNDFVTHEDLDELTQRIKSHDEFINGNGKVGAKERLGLLEVRIMEIRETTKEIVDKTVNKIVVKAFLIFGVPMILALVTWVATVLFDSAVIHSGGGFPTPTPHP